MALAHIKVSVTSTMRFRASITPKTGFSYEVTVGGVEWQNGKGREYEKEIMQKCLEIVSTLRTQIHLK